MKYTTCCQECNKPITACECEAPSIIPPQQEQLCPICGGAYLWRTVLAVLNEEGPNRDKVKAVRRILSNYV
jgi:hypothetical protein